MELLGRIQDWTPAEQRELLGSLFQVAMSQAEATVAMKLMQEVLEEHVALSEELAKHGTYIRQNYTRTLVGQSYSLTQVTGVARASVPFVPCRAG